MLMTPERWERVEELYHSALTKTPSQRGIYLAEVCADDTALQQEVESLLRQTESSSSSILDRPIPELAGLTDLKPGDELGPYRIVEILGEGGMGKVYKAFDVRLSRAVAVKVSRAEFSGRFRREARAVAALNHPNICTLYDIGPNYLVMEYVEGRPISGPLPLRDALKHAAAIAGALDSAHQKGVVHRDLKPANILLTESGPKLLDFGLAKFDPEAGAPVESASLTLTREGAITGTLQYMAPEQLQGRPSDARSDIFSFGLVFYEMLTGHPAFHADNPASLIAAILTTQPDVRQHWPIVPEAVERVLLRALAKNPRDRWQSARDLKAELESILAATAEPKPAGRTRHNLIAWVAAGVFALLAAGIAFVHFQPKLAPAPSRGTTLVTTAARTATVHQLTWFDRSGNLLGTLGDAADYSNPSISPDGRRVAVSIRDASNKRDIWVFDANGAGNRLTDDVADTANPVWSPDGSEIAYFSTRGGHRDLYVRPSSRIGVERLLLSSDQNKSPLDWRRDGKVLFFNVEETTATVFQLWMLPLPAGSQPARHVFSQEERHDWAEISPNGRWFLLRNGAHATASVILRAVPPGQGELPVCSGCSEAHWRADGREIYFIANGSMMAAGVDSANLPLSLRAPSALFPARIADLPGRNVFSVSPDGRRFLLITD